jgi:hypothetical protein
MTTEERLNRVENDIAALQQQVAKLRAENAAPRPGV